MSSVLCCWGQRSISPFPARIRPTVDAGGSTYRSRVLLPSGVKATQGNSKDKGETIALRAIPSQTRKIRKTPRAVSTSPSPDHKRLVPSELDRRRRHNASWLSTIIDKVRRRFMRKALRSEVNTLPGTGVHETSGNTHVARRVKHYPDLRHNKSFDDGEYHTAATLPRSVDYSSSTSY